ncbi:MAG: HDOD domain-containing protein [Legionellaceae bacterium]|nr:HDOD domain-containing protein [Legionellaceae bacterium]
MMIKRPIYNQHLQCVAFELLVHPQNHTIEAIQGLVHSLSLGGEKDFPLFIPYAIKSSLEEQGVGIPNPLIYKLRAADIDRIYSRDEIEASSQAIALLIEHPSQLAWLNFAEYIALSTELMNRIDVRKVVKFSQENQRKVIAYGLLQHMSFEQCRNMTMDYYCGDFIMQPKERSTNELAANKQNVLQLISNLQAADADLTRISALISTDPLLSYQLLRVVNSVAFSGMAHIESIEQALLRLGIENLKNWAQLLAIHTISDKPAEVVESGLIRAKMAEKLVVGECQISSASVAYTTGLLTILDSLMDAPLEAILNHIPIADEIRQALLYRHGPLGELLKLIIAYESGHWDDIASTQFNGHHIGETYINCLEEVARSKFAMAQTSPPP